MIPKLVLLAEDDIDDQTLFFDFLNDRNDIAILPATENGEELLAILESTRDEARLPGLIILDQNMPRMNGLQTLQALKEDQRYAHIPVVVYSTYIDAQLIREATALGASRVVGKPITKEEYDAMMDDFLSLI